MRLKATLSSKSIEALIGQLEAYQDSLNEKCKEFIERLVDIGIKEAKFALTKSEDKEPAGAIFAVKIDQSGNLTEGFITLTSHPKTDDKDRVYYPHLGWEFGVGSRYNFITHPKAAEFGMGAGTFPDQTHVPDPGYWYYKGSDDKWHKSSGFQASMPMYKASLKLAEEIESIAREVFSG